jgi:hypothetical protein
LKEGEQVVVGPAKTLLFLLDGEKSGHQRRRRKQSGAK